MLFVVRFQDNPEKAHLRGELIGQHLEFLRSQGERVRVAGSLRIEDGDRAVGGMWIVEAESFEEVHSLYATDPFWTAGMRASVEVYRLAKAYPDEPRTV